MLPPWGTGLAASALRRVGMRIPPEMLGQLRFGRGVDNRRFKAAGFRYQHTSRETVLRLGEHLRLHPVLRGAQEPYRYEREVEEFLRWSPHVRNARDRENPALTRSQVAELEGLQGAPAEMVTTEERLTAAERRAEAAELAAAEAMARAEAAEVMAERRAGEAADRAVARAKKAERRAAESALKATERAKKAERRAKEAAERAEAAAERPGARAGPGAAAGSAGGAAPGAPAAGPRPGAGAPTEHYDDLQAEDVIALLPSLERADLDLLREHERNTRQSRGGAGGGGRADGPLHPAPRAGSGAAAERNESPSAGRLPSRSLH